MLHRYKKELILKGFDKRENLVVFNAGINMKPQHNPLYEEFIFVTMPKAGKRVVLQSLLSGY